VLSELTGYVGIKASSGGMYTAVTDAPDIINEPGKDTSKMVESGAANAVLINASREDMEDALSQAMVLAGNAPGVVVEGNSACMSMADTDLFIFVIGPAPYMLKPGSEHALARADAVIINEPGNEPEGEVLRIIREYNKRAIIQTVGAPLDGVLAPLC
jgi:predicted GTPase